MQSIFSSLHYFNMTKIISLLFVAILCLIQNSGGEVENTGGDFGGSGSYQGSFSISSIPKALLSLPIKLPRKILISAFDFGKNILSFNGKVLKGPITGIRSVVNFIANIIKSVITGILNFISKIHSINVDLVVGVIRIVKGFIGWTVNQIVSLNIFGIKTGHSIAASIYDKIDKLIGGILKLIVWILVQFNKIVLGGVKLSHIEDILKLPVLKQIVSIHSDLWKKVVRLIYSQLLDIAKFIDMLIYKHRDFFYPIFQKALNIFLSFTNFINQLGDDGGIEGWNVGIKESNSGRWKAGNEYQGSDGSNSGSWSVSGGVQSGGYPGDESSSGGQVLSSGNSVDSSSSIGISSSGDSSTGNGGLSLKDLLGGDNWLDSGLSTESDSATRVAAA